MNFAQFIGGFHPALVHLPIGILLLAGLLQLLFLKPKYSALHSALSIALFWGMITAILSAVSGFLLSQSGDYDEQLVSTHKWFGIATAFVSIIAYLFNRWENVYAKWVILFMCIGIIITGHFGGMLTHGDDYLTKAFSGNENETQKQTKLIPDVQEAGVYTDIIQPIFESKCYSCHNRRKKKGGLRLDEPSFILKGGKDGEVILPGNAAESDMIKRLLLPRNHEDHMPPKEKPQLKQDQIALIHWWVASGAPFDKKTRELVQPEQIKPVLLSLQKPEPKKALPDVPEKPVAAGDDKVIKQLRENGVVIIPVTRSSNYLSANFVTVDSVTEIQILLLGSLRQQLIWLNLGNKNISDSLLKMIGELTNLTRLQLNNTPVTDKGIASLQSLMNLQYLNLVGTRVTSQGLLALKNLPHLQAIYLYKTFISSSDWTALKNNFPKVTLDTGGYQVPFLATDTVIVKLPEKKD